MYQTPIFRHGGDTALYIELGDSINPATNRCIRNMLDAIDRAAINGIKGLVPTYRSILIYYNPMSISAEVLQQSLAVLHKNLGNNVEDQQSVIEVPTLYGGEWGPDLEFVATHNNIAVEKVIKIHTGSDYLVYMVGFNPGFPYLGGMSKEIAAPRLPTPRVRITPGSVGIAEQQTGIYPLASPGGWRLIGRSPIKMFDPDRNPPALVQAGDLVRFVSIDVSQYKEIEAEVKSGTYIESVKGAN